MKILHDAIEGALLKELPEQALTILIEKKLADQGVRLSARQRKLLTRHIMKGGKDTFRLRNWKWWDHRHVKLEFTPQDAEQIAEKFTEFIENRLPDLIRTATEDMSRDVLADLKRRWRAESRRQRRELAGFRKRLYDRWKAPLEGLRMMLTMSRELGDSVNQEIRQSPDAASRRHLIDQLARSHARACQIVEEILCLLEGGFSDGAMARWRTLHGSGPSCGTTSCATTAVLWPQGRGSTPYATEPPECAPARRRWNPVPRRETAQADRRVHRSPVRDR
jgi:Family of unknown function (DUF5677)